MGSAKDGYENEERPGAEEAFEYAVRDMAAEGFDRGAVHAGVDEVFDKITAEAVARHYRREA